VCNCEDQGTARFHFPAVAPRDRRFCHISLRGVMQPHAAHGPPQMRPAEIAPADHIDSHHSRDAFAAFALWRCARQPASIRHCVQSKPYEAAGTHRPMLPWAEVLPIAWLSRTLHGYTWNCSLLPSVFHPPNITPLKVELQSFPRLRVYTPLGEVRCAKRLLVGKGRYPSRAKATPPRATASFPKADTRSRTSAPTAPRTLAKNAFRSEGRR
jgi:hypothetical protein